MKIILIEINDEDELYLSNIQDIGNDIINKYTSITSKECNLNDEIVILTMKLDSESL